METIQIHQNWENVVNKILSIFACDCFFFLFFFWEKVGYINDKNKWGHEHFFSEECIMSLEGSKTCLYSDVHRLGYKNNKMHIFKRINLIKRLTFFEPNKMTIATMPSFVVSLKSAIPSYIQIAILWQISFK